MCSAWGLNGRLGATKRRILSLAEIPSLFAVPLGIGMEVALLGVPLVIGVAEGMTARSDTDDEERRMAMKEKS